MTRIVATAPVRICDAGGWTDTWFAGSGVVCSLAVEPGARVAIEAHDHDGPTVLTIDATGERYEIDRASPIGRHPLLETTIGQHKLTTRRALDVHVAAAVPPGCGVGTSAAVVVALLHALDTLHGDVRAPGALAAAAHEVELALGLQSGVQDQHAAAHGGCNRMTISPYPHTTVEPIALDPATLAALADRLVTVYLGRPHHSSSLHEHVIATLDRSKLDPLRAAACAAADALARGDLDGYGAALVANTEAQAALHERLVCDDARRLVALARAHGAAGWKVNGAGGDGGSTTVLAPADPDGRAAFVAAVDAVTGWQRLPLRPAASGARSFPS